MLERLQRLPVPVLPAMVGACTLSNVYAGMGYPWVRHLTTVSAMVILLVYCIKIAKHRGTVRAEYRAVVPSSLYAGFTMLLMLAGAYLLDFVPLLGRGLWLFGVVLHFAHIVLFTYRNVLRVREKVTFLPSWFVTYNGIMVSVVIGGGMGFLWLRTAITYYGIAVYAILIPLLIYRLMTADIPLNFYHTQAIVLAPCSLCVVSYLNVAQRVNGVLLTVLYLCVLLSICFVVYRLPRFFAHPFSPSFAGMTFPMAIGIVATNKVSDYLSSGGFEVASNILTQLSGVQIYFTTAIIGYVLLNFVMLALRTPKV